ncbi:glutathione synthase [Polychaeton citri CBS 116435]|uniref:Glutathione synthetase n=1 Tax=Polychaeton citri CBS 116435 TaxID=1314669 RepID=A0A9P4ULN8_9PEZI|nr:glutathione synthase [Polychaeton citri CBS 116435]
MADLYPPYPPPLSPEEESYLLSNLKDWSIAHGLAVRPPPSYVPEAQNPGNALAANAPVTLFPSLFPRTCFEQASDVAQAYNVLYSAIACDEAWLGAVVEELIEIDDFMAGLWKVHLKVKGEGYAQPLSLGLFRSDYMVHVDPEQPLKPTVKQVEFNTIAASFGGLSINVAGLHKYLQLIGAYPPSMSSLFSSGKIPEGQSVPGLALGMAKAHEAYGPSSLGRQTCILFLVQDTERNVFDQRHLEYEIIEKHNITTFRIPWTKVLQQTKLDDQRRLLYLPPQRPDQEYEVSVVYFRAGYAPSEYNGQADWDARLHIERSAAIKCPNILTHLAGTKKVQQVLATPHSPHLSRFLKDSAEADAVLKTFAPIYPMDKSEAGLQARRLASDPESASRYVLKPQREGGGNNIYRKDIPDFLKSLPEQQWPAYILMEMIEPPAQNNVVLRNGELQDGGVICELGVYGACLWRQGEGDGKGEVLYNGHAPYLLRTKGSGVSEGGVATGYSALDSVLLVDK